MKHAFMIMAYNNWNQLKTLIELLDDPRNSIFVHIDAKSQDFNPSLFENAANYATLQFVPRIDITWGGSSQIDCEILLLQHALVSHSDYYHLLSGMDLPLHSMDYIDNYFLQHSGQEFIQFGQIGDAVDIRVKDRISTYHPLQNILGRRMHNVNSASEILQRKLRINRLARYHGTLAKGAQWFSITYNLAHYVVEQWPQYQRMFSSSWCADELFLQTVAVNSPFKASIHHPQPDDDYEANGRLIEWDSDLLRTFLMEDYKRLIASPRLFARKFDERVDGNIITAISQHVLGTE